MCGICGIFEPGRETAIDPTRVKAMADTIRHRGPDDEGCYTAPGIGLGFRRLSIIDVKGGHQPLSNEDGTIWIAFNGEIYNFEELNRRYLSSGHRFKTRSDTETIVHLYEELGEDCFAQLRGMFAIALWDGRRKRLAAGAGPDRQEAAVLFLGWPAAGIWLRDQGYLGGGWDLQRVRHGSSFRLFLLPIRSRSEDHLPERAEAAARRITWWSEGRIFAKCPTGTSTSMNTQDLSEAEWCESFLAEYRTAVKSRLISDVPLGAFLSAGVDSSSVVALMNEFQPPVTTCSIGFTEQRYDEATDARAIRERRSARTTSSTLCSRRRLSYCRSWPGTMMSRSPIRRRFRPTMCRRWRGSM